VKDKNNEQKKQNFKPYYPPKRFTDSHAAETIVIKTINAI